jgi:tight adherence protein C
MPVVVIVALSAIGLSIPLAWLAVSGGKQTPAAGVNRNLTRGLTDPTDLRQVLLTKSASERTVQPLMRNLSRSARRLLPAGVIEPVERVLAAKLGLGVLGLVFGLLGVSSNPNPRSFAFLVAATCLGLFGPDMILDRRGRERQLQIQRKLPDTLDQVTICVEAGLGFEAAMARAGGSGTGPLADELVRTLQQMQLGSSRGQALRDLIERTDAPDLRRFVLALIQAESYGLPIADVLRTQAAEQRTKRRQRAEEHAMKIPVKIIFPLVLCILPALMIAVMGPSGIRMARFFSGGLP